MKIAIQGHPTRGKEVIRSLESLGGINKEGLTGIYKTFYYIDDKNEISDDHKKYFSSTYKFYTLEEFEKEFPFKIGDRVISVTTNSIGTITKLKENGWYYVRYDNGNLVCVCRQRLKLYKEMKRNITLTLEKAKEWYKKGGELREIALQAFTENELNPLPKSWEEFCERYPVKKGESWMGSFDTIYCATNTQDRIYINWIPSKKSAEAHVAMVQLEQLRNCWWGDWEPKWNASHKYAIKNLQGEVTILGCSTVAAFLTFPTSEMAEEFLKCFRDLIEKAGDLI